MKTKLLVVFALFFTVALVISMSLPVSASLPQETATPTSPQEESALPPNVASYDDLLALYDYDADAPLDIQEVGVEEQNGIAVHDISFASPADGRVIAYLVVPPGEGPFAGVLYVHWLGGSSTSNRSEFLPEALAMAEHGVVSLLVTAVWGGERGPTFFVQRDTAADSAISIKQVVDLRRAVDVLLAQPTVDPERLAYVGHDFGAMYGAILSGVDTRLHAYVLMAGNPLMSNWFLLGPNNLDEAELAHYINDIAVFDPVYYVAHAAPASLFFQFATRDQYITPEDAQAFIDAASDPKQAEYYRGGHQFIGEDDETDRLEWLTEQLALAAAE